MFLFLVLNMILFNRNMLKQQETLDLVLIYTERYPDNPMIIQGAGAGASVTARGVFGDILRLAQKN